jgi:hypothetical protein
MSESGLTVARAIGSVAADDPPQLRAPRHSLSERLPAVDIGQSDHGGVDDWVIDIPDPVDTAAAATERIPAKVHAEDEWPGRVARPRAGRQKGYVVVAAMVAASAGVTASLV